ncbi:MAG: hypothetical protein ABI760_01730 [Ferruginibacter sp.]
MAKAKDEGDYLFLPAKAGGNSGYLLQPMGWMFRCIELKRMK